MVPLPRVPLSESLMRKSFSRSARSSLSDTGPGVSMTRLRACWMVKVPWRALSSSRGCDLKPGGLSGAGMNSKCPVDVSWSVHIKRKIRSIRHLGGCGSGRPSAVIQMFRRVAMSVPTVISASLIPSHEMRGNIVTACTSRFRVGWRVRNGVCRTRYSSGSAKGARG